MVAARAGGDESADPRIGRMAGLTPREAEVFRLVARRYRNSEIAESLVISKRTVESHVASILRKVGAANRFELIRLGRGSADAPPTGAPPDSVPSQRVPRRHADPRIDAPGTRASARAHRAAASRTVERSRRLVAEAHEQVANRRIVSAEAAVAKIRALHGRDDRSKRAP